MATLVSRSASDSYSVGAVALTLEVRPVTGGAGLDAAILHFEPGKLGLQRLDPRVQGIDIRPVTGRSPGGQPLVLNVGQIDVDPRFAVVSGVPRQPQAAYQRPGGLLGSSQPVSKISVSEAFDAHHGRLPWRRRAKATRRPVGHKLRCVG